MTILFSKYSKKIKVENLMDKLFISDGMHQYQMDASYLDKLVEKLINRGYRSVINK